MKHFTNISGYEKLDDNRYLVVIMCCGVHRHPHPVASDVIINEAKLSASIDWAHKEAAKNHEALCTHEPKLKALLDATMEHEL